MPNIEVSRPGIPAESGALMLVITATPGAPSERILSAFGHAGWVVPRGAELERWTALARAGGSGVRSRIAFLHSSGNGVAGQLVSAYGAPVVVAIEADGGDVERVWQEALMGVPLVLLYSGPESSLRRAMREGRSPASALESWMYAARSMISAYRADPERVALIDAERAISSPAAFIQACRQRFGMNVPETALGGDGIEGTWSAEEHLHSMLAEHMVMRSPEAMELMEQLTGCALPMGLPRIGPEPDYELVLRDHRSLAEREERLAEELGRMRARADELDERNESLEGANAALYRQLRDAHEALASALNAALAEPPAGAPADDRALTEELELLREEHRALMDAYDEQLRAIGRLRDEIGGLASEREEARQRTARLEEELSELGARRQQLEDEQELLVLQLAQTQDELEQTTALVQESRVREDAQRRQIAALETSVKLLETKLRKTEGKLERAERLLALRERRLSYIERSQSWKLTAPLRGAIRWFRPPAEKKLVS